MGGDEVLDRAWQVVLFGKCQAVRYMLDYYPCTLFGWKLIVRDLSSALILGEVDGVLCLAYIMEQCSCSYFKAVRSNVACCVGCKVAYLHGVLECAGCLL